MSLWVIPIMFTGMFVQTLAGFGSGMIAMPLLIGILGVEHAAAAFAISSQVHGISMIWRYRKDFRWRDIWRLSVTSLLLIPVGVWLAGYIPERVAMIGLGVVLLVYSLYSLAGFQLPKIKNANWGFLFGGVSGLLAGAYNVGGPPYVIYGTSSEWEPERFKVNLQALFFIGGIVVILSHGVNGNITADVLRNVVLMILAIGAALVAGFALDRFVQPEPFRRGVLVLLLLLALSLIF